MNSEKVLIWEWFEFNPDKKLTEELLKKWGNYKLTEIFDK